MNEDEFPTLDQQNETAELADESMDNSAEALLALLALLASGEITQDSFSAQVQDEILSEQTRAYLLGRGGESQMGESDFSTIDQLAEDQFGFFEATMARFAAGLVSVAALGALLYMYARSANLAYNTAVYTRATSGTAFEPLPAMPGDGTSPCLTNCGCYWLIEKISEGEEVVALNAYWNRGKQDSCTVCLERAQNWSPIRLGKR